MVEILRKRTEIQLQIVDASCDLLSLGQQDQPSLIVFAPDNSAHRDVIGACGGLRSLPVTADIPLMLVGGPDCRKLAREIDFDAVVYEPLVHDDLLAKVRRYVPLRYRRHPRYPINLRFTFQGGAVRGQAFSRVLSCGGAFLKTDRVLEVGDTIQLCFRLPGAAGETRCNGIIRSSLQWFQDPRATPGFGVEFRDLARDDRERLNRFVESLERRAVNR